VPGTGEQVRQLHDPLLQAEQQLGRLHCNGRDPDRRCPKGRCRLARMYEASRRRLTADRSFAVAAMVGRLAPMMRAEGAVEAGFVRWHSDPPHAAVDRNDNVHLYR
jgi:hypothetical protein